MTDQTTAPSATTCDFPACVHPDHVRVGCPNEDRRDEFVTVSPPPAPRPEDDPVWRRLVTDCAAFQRAYPTPAHLAELVLQLTAAGAEHGIHRVWLSADVRPAPPSPAQLVAEVLNDAAKCPGDPSVAALHALAHAGQRARAHVATAAGGDETTTGGNCDG